MDSLISRQAAIDVIEAGRLTKLIDAETAINGLKALLPAQPEIIRCKDCKYWKQQTNYQCIPLSFGFCENDNMWRSLCGETCEISHIETDDNHYCGYAERRTDNDSRN